MQLQKSTSITGLFSLFLFLFYNGKAMNFCEPNVYFRFSRFFFLPQSLFPSSSFSIVRVFKPQRTTFVLGPSFMFFTSFSVAGSRKLQRRLRLTEDAEQNCVIGECGFYFFGGSFSSPPPPPPPVSFSRRTSLSSFLLCVFLYISCVFFFFFLQSFLLLSFPFIVANRYS